MYEQSSLQNIKIQYYVVLKVCKYFFLTRLGFPKTPAFFIGELGKLNYCSSR